MGYASFFREAQTGFLNSARFIGSDGFNQSLEALVRMTVAVRQVFEEADTVQ